jgi:hypothetical protein
METRTVFINPVTKDSWINSFGIPNEKIIKLSYDARIALFWINMEDYKILIDDIINWKLNTEEQILEATKWKSRELF